MKLRIKLLIILISVIVLIGCDRATKELAKEYLTGQGQISFIEDIFRLQFVENTGAFLSFGSELPKTLNILIFSVLPSVFLLFLLGYTLVKSREFSFLELFPYVLIFSGGSGNIIDRIVFDRHVIDFMNVGIQNLRTGIFNFADFYITTGVIIFVVFNIRKSMAKKDVITIDGQ